MTYPYIENVEPVATIEHAGPADAEGRCGPLGLPQGYLCTPAFRASDNLGGVRSGEPMGAAASADNENRGDREMVDE